MIGTAKGGRSPVFAGNAGFQYIVEIRRTPASDGQLCLSISTVFDGARDPDAERQVFQVTTTAPGLKSLAELITQETAAAAIAAEPHSVAIDESVVAGAFHPVEAAIQRMCLELPPGPGDGELDL